MKKFQNLSLQRLLVLAVKFLNFQAFVNNTSPNTSKSYANDLNQFLAPLGLGRIIYRGLNYAAEPELSPGALKRAENKPFGRQQYHEITQLIRAAQKKWSPLKASSRNRKYATLKSFFGWAQSEGHIGPDLASQIICPKVPQKIPHFVSLDEALSLIKAIQKSKDEFALRDLVLVLLLYGAGLRVSEASGLRWKDINLQKSTIRVLGKGGKHRWVAGVPLLMESLKEQKKNLSTDDSEYVFGVQPLHTRKAFEIIRKRGAQAGLLKPLNPHALRHSFATHLLSSGTDLRILQELLGHSSLTATQKYLHLSLDSLARTMEKAHPLK